MRLLARSAIAFVILAACATSPLGAQSAGTDASADFAAAQTAQAGPTAAGAAVGVRASIPVAEHRSDLASALQQEPGVGRNMALMIVGGAAVITGLLIGDDLGAVLAVGGAVVGLYGLYQWVR